MNIFDIIGPVMVGPSSSHTAGAARIGFIAYRILKAVPVSAAIGFHGSFADTYRGHGSDRAVIGGLLGFTPDDERLRDSLTLAREAGLSFRLERLALPAAHPNTIVITAQAADGQRLTLQGISVGGGSVSIQRINGIDVDFDGSYDTLVVGHKDSLGAVALVSSLLSVQQVNIAGMRVFRSRRAGDAIMVIEIDGKLPDKLLSSLESLPNIEKATYIEKIEF